MLVAVADGAAEFHPDVLHPPRLLECVEAFEGSEVLEIVADAFENDLLVVVELFAELLLESFEVEVGILPIFDMLTNVRLGQIHQFRVTRHEVRLPNFGFVLLDFEIQFHRFDVTESPVLAYD